MDKKQPKKAVKRSSCGTKGGSVLSDMSKLAVPFGLIAAKKNPNPKLNLLPNLNLQNPRKLKLNI